MWPMRSPACGPTTLGTETTQTACSATHSSRRVLVVGVQGAGEAGGGMGDGRRQGVSEPWLGRVGRRWVHPPRCCRHPALAVRSHVSSPPTHNPHAVLAGHPEARPRQPSGAVPGQPGGPGHRHPCPRHPICGGQLGVACAGCLGPWLGGARRGAWGPLMLLLCCAGAGSATGPSRAARVPPCRRAATPAHTHSLLGSSSQAGGEQPCRQPHPPTHLHTHAHPSHRPRHTNPNTSTGVAGRHGGDPVHLLPAGGRQGARGAVCGDHLRPGAHPHVPAGAAAGGLGCVGDTQRRRGASAQAGAGQAPARPPLDACSPALCDPRPGTVPQQGAKHFKDIQYAPGVTYGEMFLQNEYEMSGAWGFGYVCVCTCARVRRHLSRRPGAAEAAGCSQRSLRAHTLLTPPSPPTSPTTSPPHSSASHQSTTWMRLMWRGSASALTCTTRQGGACLRV